MPRQDKLSALRQEKSPALRQEKSPALCQEKSSALLYTTPFRSLSVRRLCTDAMLLCTALILSWLDTLIPFPFGMKAGLANCVIMTASRSVSPKDAAVISLLRIGIMSVLFGSVTSLAFSLGGGVMSFAVLLLTLPLSRRRKITLIGVSVLSSAAHTVGQMIAACLLFESLSPLGMLWWLLLCAVPTGIFTGIASELTLRRIGKKKVSL